MSVMVDHQIRDACRPRARRDQLISPFYENLLQSASYDVRLGSKFIVIDATLRGLPPRPVDLSDPKTLVDLYTEFVLREGDFYELRPGGFVLGHTVEIICVPEYISAHVQGKSSIARLGLAIESAGFIDPGYYGSITLEITNFASVPVLLRPGLTIAQFLFQQLDEVPEVLYGEGGLGSHYQGSESVVGSRYGLDVTRPFSSAPAPPYEERRTTKPCRWCGEEIQSGQSYAPDGPLHIGCAVLHDRRRSM